MVLPIGGPFQRQGLELLQEKQVVLVKLMMPLAQGREGLPGVPLRHGYSSDHSSQGASTRAL